RAGEGGRVAVGSQQARAGLGREQRLGVTPVTECRVEVEPGTLAQEFQRLSEQDRLMTPTHARPPPAPDPGSRGWRGRRRASSAAARAGAATARTPRAPAGGP